jgi:hypothetical protein
MADQKISAMPTASVPLTGAELMPLVQDGANVKSTISAYGDYARTKYFNHGAWQDTTTQTGSITAGTPFTFNTADVTDGITLVSGSRLTVPIAGVYNFQWSGQFENVENTIESVTVWLRIDGVDVPGSAGIINLAARKNPSITGRTIIGWNYFLTLIANQYVQIVWLPSVATINLPAFPASLVTPIHPSTASVIVTVNQVG